ncbi:hypothetical protein BC937DRAFT_89462 [Endogone sp. FLAS-F59071]|nr:hypothetical protein BC937DRAFT_89462 [Endogone sp. FLAS-F59071]|eukprot:RUS22387.1 hypothetical protein BC937DRAFT_89462 [Endogone sp. FLAS-F59071]
MIKKQSQSSREYCPQKNVDWILSSPNPTPLAFFRMIRPTHRGPATHKYWNAFKTALNRIKTNDSMGLGTVDRREESGMFILILHIEFRQENHNTNIKIQKKFFSLVEKKDAHNTENFNVNEIAERNEDDDSEEEAEDNGMEEEAENSLAITSSGTSNNAPEDEKEGQDNDDNANGDYVERVEQDTQDTLYHQKQWILSSGTDVAAVLKQYAQTIPEIQKCLNDLAFCSPIYWGILDLTGEHVETKGLFTAADWKEMVDNFDKEVKLSETIAPDIVYHLFDTVNEIVNSGKGNVGEIERISVESIQREASKLSRDDEDKFIAVKRALLTYAENLADIDLPMSEMTFDNLFTNMLARRFLDKKELKMDVLKLSSGSGVAVSPQRTGKFFFEDRTDLMVAMRDILYTFFAANPNATDEKLHQTFVLGIQSWVQLTSSASSLSGTETRDSMDDLFKRELETIYNVTLKSKSSLKDFSSQITIRYWLTGCLIKCGSMED